MEDKIEVFKLDGYGTERTEVDLDLIETLPNGLELKFEIGAYFYTDHGKLILDPLLIKQPDGRYVVIGNIIAYYVYVLRGFKSTNAYVLRTMPSDLLRSLGDKPLSVKSMMTNIVHIFSFFSGEFTGDVLVATKEEKEKLYADIAGLIDWPLEDIKKIDVVRMYADEVIVQAMLDGHIGLNYAFDRAFDA